MQPRPFCPWLKKSGWLALILALPLLAGCGRSKPGSAMTGTVSYNDVPVEFGSILLYEVDAQDKRTGNQVAARIEKGKYRLVGIKPGLRYEVGIGAKNISMEDVADDPQLRVDVTSPSMNHDIKLKGPVR